MLCEIFMRLEALLNKAEPGSQRGNLKSWFLRHPKLEPSTPKRAPNLISDRESTLSARRVTGVLAQLLAQGCCSERERERPRRPVLLILLWAGVADQVVEDEQEAENSAAPKEYFSARALPGSFALLRAFSAASPGAFQQAR